MLERELEGEAAIRITKKEQKEIIVTFKLSSFKRLFVK